MCSRAKDQELIREAIAGDRNALGQLLLQQYERLAACLEPQLPDDLRPVFSVEDILQQAFAQAFRDICQFTDRGEGSFFAWLKTVAEHRLRDAIKRQRRQKRGGGRRRVEHVDPASSSSAVQLIEILAADDTTASQVLAHHEAEQALRVALAALSEDQRSVVELRHLQKKSWSEIADTMGRSPAAVRSLEDRARKKLRDALGSLSRYLSGK
jgi:RNA polymerase sigma-70 factor (ECF subfamily)